MYIEANLNYLNLILSYNHNLSFNLIIIVYTPKIMLKWVARHHYKLKNALFSTAHNNPYKYKKYLSEHIIKVL
jgi:hypothetical protein